MSQLWNELANQKRPEEPLNAKNNTIVAAQARSIRRAALICPVNNNFDFAANRNAALFTERFESAWNFDKVVLEDSARSSQSKPSASIVAVVVPAIEELLGSPEQPHMLVIYITCSTAVDIAEIYDNVAAAILGRDDESAASQQQQQNDIQAMIIVDAPCIAPLQVAPGAQLPIPLLVPRATFDGHIALKFLHAAHDCGDEGTPITLEAVASRISPIATLMGSTDGTRYPWNPVAAPSCQAVTFLISSSIEPIDEAALKAIDGRNVGKALKQQMPGARLRYLVEKEQPVVLNFNAEDTLRPPEIAINHEDCAAEFEAALAGVGIFSTRLGNVMPSIDRRFVASVSVPSNNNNNNNNSTPSSGSSALQMETLKLWKAVAAQTIRLQVSHRIPQKTFLATNMALAFKYEATATYRAYLLLEALVRLHVASPEHRLRIEDLTPPVIAGENVDAGVVPPFMFIRAGVAASAAGISPRRQMFVSTNNNNNNNNNALLSQTQQNNSTSRALPMNVTLQQTQQEQSMMNVSAASPLPGSSQHQQQVLTANNVEAIVNQVLAASKQEQEQQIRNAVRQEIQQSVPQIVREQVQESNMQMASQFQQALEQMRAEFFMELRKTAEFNTSEIRETESRWKKHLLLIENRLQRLEVECDDIRQEQQQNQQQNQTSVPRGGGVSNNNNSSNNNYSPLTIRKEIASAVESLGTPMQQLDQKVSTLSSRLDSTSDRLLSLEQLVSTSSRNLTSSQDSWMTQRDVQLQQFSSTLTQTLEQRLAHFISEGRMRIFEERFDEFVETYQQNSHNNNNNQQNSLVPVAAATVSSPSPSRALTERISSIEATAEQARRECATLEQKLISLDESTKRVISSSEEAMKSDLSTSVNRFSSDLSQRLVAYLNDSITRINAELNHMKSHMSTQIDSSVAIKLSSQQDNFSDLTGVLETNVKKSTTDIRDLRTRVQQLEVGQQSGVQTLTEQDKSKNQRITALEEHVGRLTNFIRSM